MQSHELFERLNSYGHDVAMIHDGIETSYQALIELAEKAAERLKNAGVQTGDVVGLEGDFSPASVAGLLAIWQAGGVAMPLSSALQARRETCLEISRCKWIFTPDENSSIKSIQLQYKNQENPTLIDELKQRGHPGLILFTSGTTAEPKAVLHDATVFLEKFRLPRPPARTLAFLIFDHMGGLDTLFYTLSSGGTLVTLPPGERGPEQVAQTIEKYHVELLPTSPTFLNFLLMSGMHEKYNLSSLKRISYGTEPMPEMLLKRLTEIFPNVKWAQSYGTSELGVPRVKGKEGDSAWIRLGGDGFETRVVDGQLQVRSATAMIGYLNAPSPFDAEGWYATGDAVEVEETGTFYRVLGRATEIIVVGGEKVAPAEVESVLIQADNVADVQVTSAPNPLLGKMIVARVVLGQPEPLTDLSRRLRGFCAGKLANYQIPVKFEIVSEVDRTSRGKLKRD